MNPKNLENIYEWPLPSRMLIFTVVCLITVYLGYLFDLSRILDEMDGKEKQETELKEQLTDVIIRSKKINTALTQVPVVKATLQEWRNKIIQYDQLPELLNDILKVGADNHLYFNAFNPSLGKKGEYYSRIAIKVVVMGNYHQMAMFLSQVANLKSIVSVRNFQVTNAVASATQAKPDQPVSTGGLTMDAVLEVYYVPERVAHAK